ncbi:hypothetical protein GGR52DRAFT_182592 [Hypoxylon sp. FL1284]|nr:hypothetical protein GGR52DRAFT_182592 [Hypoxylon sp. FL1284]
MQPSSTHCVRAPTSPTMERPSTPHNAVAHHHQAKKAPILGLPAEITLTWMGMLDPDDLFTLFRVGNRAIYETARDQILTTSSKALQSALYWACLDGDVEFVEETLARRARIAHELPFRPASEDHTVPAHRISSTALNIAIYRQHIDVVRILLDEDPVCFRKVDEVTVPGRPSTPIQWALWSEEGVQVDEEKRLRIVELLIDRGVSDYIFYWGSDPDAIIAALLNDHIPVAVVKRLMGPDNNRYWYSDHNGNEYYEEYIRALKQPTSEAFTPNQLQKLRVLQRWFLILQASLA